MATARAFHVKVLAPERSIAKSVQALARMWGHVEGAMERARFRDPQKPALFARGPDEETAANAVSAKEQVNIYPPFLNHAIDVMGGANSEPIAANVVAKATSWFPAKNVMGPVGISSKSEIASDGTTTQL